VSHDEIQHRAIGLLPLGLYQVERRRPAHSSRSEWIDARHRIKAFDNERDLPWLWVMLLGATHWLQERQNRPIGSN
jgi:hypothetical protein